MWEWNIAELSSLKSIFNHSHKKKKDSLETQAELAVLRSYVENQATLEPILLYRASKCKQTKELGKRGLFMDPYFNLFIRLLSVSFIFFCQDKNKTRSNCAIMGCNLSKKYKLTLYKSQNGEPNYGARS